MNVSAAGLKQLFQEHLDLSSTNLEDVAKSFTKLYVDYQGDVVKKVSVQTVPDTRYTWIDPPFGRSQRVVLFFHGGGYTMGSTADHMQLISSLVLLSGISMLGIDYRLCPQHRFPAPLDDAECAYRWLMEDQKRAPEAIGFAGISAGGLLVTQLICRCQNRGIPIPSVALNMSGPMDLDFDRSSCTYNSEHDIVVAERLRNIQNYYLPQEPQELGDELHPAGIDYQQYPRTLFQAGDCEVLLDDNVEFYRILRQQGHAVHLQVIPNMIHCGQMFSTIFRPGEIAIEGAAQFLKDSFPKL
jgi:monoterpene epsilon-lactone hydrolase|tara:strand:- start:338 stop:1234 length:897 start_codon:yes stop_codon:yes gene_type:complete